MSRPVLRDDPARARIASDLGRNLLVEAGAGSGKTHEMARRMAAGVAGGVYAIEQMAAVTFTRKAAAEMQVDGYCACAAALQDYDFTVAAAGLTVPVQLLAGANDGAMPTVMAAMAETIPGAKLSVIEGAGHIPNVEKPEAFNRALFEFFMLADQGRCTPRDPRSAASGILGFKK